MRNTLAALSAFAALAACATVCAEVSALDSSGRRVALAMPAQRIVSLAPHAPELLYAACAGAKEGAATAWVARAFRGRPPIDVFYQISQRPLMTLSGRHFVSDALALCGGRNVFAGAPIIAPEIDAEAVLAADPQAIIAARPDPAD